MSQTPPPRKLNTVVRQTPIASSTRPDRQPRGRAVAVRPAFASLSTFFLVLLVIAIIGTLFAAVTAMEYSNLFAFIILLINVPSIVSFYALHIILAYLATD